MMLVSVAGCSKDSNSTTPSVAPIASDQQQVQNEASTDTTSSSTHSVASNREPSNREPSDQEPTEWAPSGQGPDSDSKSSPDPLELVDTASIALENGNIDLAFDTARQAFRIAPKHPEVAFLMARLLGEQRRFHEAIDMLDRLAASHPDMQLPILGQTADWMVQAGQWKDAETRFVEILKQMPRVAIAHRNLAELYVRQGRRSKAVEHVNTLCRIGDINESELRTLLKVFCPLPVVVDGETLEPIGDLGNARTEISRGEWKQAQERLESAKVDLPETTALLARIYATTENVALPEHLESNSITEHPDHWFAKGVLAANSKRHTDAIRFFANCVLADQTDCDAYLAMSRSLETIGMDDKASEVAIRSQLIRKTQRLGEQTGDALEQKAMLELADFLGQLHRPLEAIAWKGVALAYAQSRGLLSEKEVQSSLVEMNQARSECLASRKESPDRDFLLCEIDLEDLPTKADRSENSKPNTTP